MIQLQSSFLCFMAPVCGLPCGLRSTETSLFSLSLSQGAKDLKEGGEKSLDISLFLF